MDLLQAADALVTVESLSAVEALVLGRPVLILNGAHEPPGPRGRAAWPWACPAGADPTDALRRLLFDPATRDALADARDRYLSDVAAGVDGRATERHPGPGAGGRRRAC